MNAKLLFEELEIKAMPQVELEKMLNMLLLRKSKGYTQFELSFLIGQRDFYVRDAESPNHTLVYTVPFTNIFRQIFSCDTAAIVPNINRKPVYSIRILEATDETGNSVYRAERKIDDGDWEFIDTFGPEPKDLLLESKETTTTEQEVRNWVIGKFAGDYFDTAKNALEILKDCEKQLNSSVRPLFLANALKACNGTKGLPKLSKTKDGNGRFVYRV